VRAAPPAAGSLFQAPARSLAAARAAAGRRRLLRPGSSAFGTVNSWLLWRLTGGQGACHGTAATQPHLLMDLELVSEDPELCDAFGVPAAFLPELRPCHADFARHQCGACPPPVLPIRPLLAFNRRPPCGQKRLQPG